MVLCSIIYIWIGFISPIVGNWQKVNLPLSHIPCFFNNNPEALRHCHREPECPFKNKTETCCWGYEAQCETWYQFHIPVCPDSSHGWASTKSEQLTQFWNSADFGLVKIRRSEMKIICKGQGHENSLLECVDYARLCRVRNLYINLQNAKLTQRTYRYDENLLLAGDIGGDCVLNKKLLKQHDGHKSPLQSWYAEIENFSEISVKNMSCDVTLERPTYLIKIDAVVNLYHHFCDFINLYLSQHFNSSFSTDVNVIIWDTHAATVRDHFKDSWSVFSHHPIIDLVNLDGKRVCIKNALFSFLPRMRYGLYYNMPLIPGCSGSGLIRAFHEHLLYRLHIHRADFKDDPRIRVTILSRKAMYRNILNEADLISALQSNSRYHVTRVVYDWSVPFLSQIQQTYNTDIFVGMHGAGLTHALFLPDWAVLFELFNCGDELCYKDLARLRGVKYVTWNNMDQMVQEDEGHHPTLGAHKKFTNYWFEPRQFMRKISEASDHVQGHPQYRKYRESLLTPRRYHDDL